MTDETFTQAMSYLGGLKKKALAARESTSRAEEGGKPIPGLEGEHAQAARECETLDIIIRAMAELEPPPASKAAWTFLTDLAITFLSFCLGLGLGGLAFLGIRLVARSLGFPAWWALAALAALAAAVTALERIRK